MRIIETSELGCIIKRVRQQSGLTQEALACVAGVGIRFVRELEAGKKTCQLGKALHILQMLGIKVDLQLPRTLEGESLV